MSRSHGPVVKAAAKASSRRENFFEVFNRDIVTDGALAFAGSYVGSELGAWANSSNLFESLIPKIVGGILTIGGLYIGIPFTINGFLNSSCDPAKGGLTGSDICRSYDSAIGR